MQTGFRLEVQIRGMSAEIGTDWEYLHRRHTGMRLLPSEQLPGNDAKAEDLRFEGDTQSLQSCDYQDI